MTKTTIEQAPLHRRTCIAACLCLVSLLFSGPLWCAEDIIVVVNGSSPSSGPISRYVLASIFGMRLTAWPDGSEIKVFVLPDDNPVHALFCKQTLHIFPHQLRAAWDRLIYSGTGPAPEVVGTEQEIRARIATTAGAIGYLSKKSLDDTIQILPVQ